MKRRVVLFSVFALALAWFGRDGVRVHAQTKVGPDQLKTPRITVLHCVEPPETSPNCMDLYYVDVITAAGTELKLIGAPATQFDVIDPTKWVLVP